MSEPAPERPAERGGLELNLKWLWLPASLAVLFVLRSNLPLLLAYVVAVIGFIAVWFVVLPKKALDAERVFHRDALRHLASDDLDGLDRLIERQGLIRRFGRPHVLPDTRALAASARGDHEAAYGLYVQALGSAPPEDRPRIELNLAAEEMATGRHEAAEGRYRTALARRPDLTPARINLARLLLEQGESLREAARLAGEAATDCDRRERGDVLAMRAEALARLGDAGWRDAAEAAREAGVAPAELERIAGLASAR